MKTKRILSIALSLVLMFSILFSTNVFAASYNADAALQYAKAHWNEGGKSHKCAEFISKCLTAGGISMNYTGTGSLYKAVVNNGYATKYKISNFNSNRIKFSDYSGKISAGDVLATYCTVCGQYTHVMLISGSDKNGYVTYYAWNSNKNNATFWNNSYFCNNSSKHAPIETHVWHINSNKSNSTNTKATPIKKPALNVTSYPTTINQGASFGMRGSVAANGAKTTVTTTVTNRNGKTVLSANDTVSANSTGNIKDMNVNKKLSFGNLPAGTYMLKISANNIKGTSTFSTSFTIKGKTKTSTVYTKPTLKVTSYPTSIKKGASFGMRGSVAANGAKTTVTTTVTNSKGKTVLSASDTVSANSTGNIKDMNVNKKLLFNKLSKGTYTLKIVAKNNGGTSTFSIRFKVK